MHLFTFDSSIRFAGLSHSLSNNRQLSQFFSLENTFVIPFDRCLRYHKIAAEHSKCKVGTRPSSKMTDDAEDDDDDGQCKKTKQKAKNEKKIDNKKK